MEAEVWISPGGVEANLVNVRIDLDGWFAEDPGQRPPYAYELRSTFNGKVIEAFTVSPYEPWSPYDAASDLLRNDGWTPPPPTEEEMAECEHGMSAALCAGPGHYPMDL